MKHKMILIAVATILLWYALWHAYAAAKKEQEYKAWLLDTACWVIQHGDAEEVDGYTIKDCT